MYRIASTFVVCLAALGLLYGSSSSGIASSPPSSSLSSPGEHVEVLHWWTSGAEATALNILRQDLAQQGVEWRDMPVAGGGGEQAMTVLRARVMAGNAPAAVQMLGFDIQDWAQQGTLANLNRVAVKENWDKVVPAALKHFSKHGGKWIAAPVNVHSTNWVWANKRIFSELAISEPKTWDDLVAALSKIKAAGYVAVAHGGQAWQDATIFDAVVMSVGGPGLYRSALIELDEKALGSAQMKQAFQRMATIRSFVDDNFSGRDWNLASAMVIEGKAAVQFMGDWAKGEFLKAGLKPGSDFLCFRFPGTADSVIFNADQFAMFSVDEQRSPAQMKLASAIMKPSFQSAFNIVKGSVPARTDIDMKTTGAEFDACGQRAIKELAAASDAGKLLGSMAHGHAAPAAIKNAVYDVVTAHFNGEYDADTAVQELRDAVEAAR